MGIGSIFGKVVGFFGAAVPTIMKFSEAIELVLNLVKVGVAKNDVSKIELALDSADGVADGFEALAAEIREFTAAGRAAIDPDGPGGSDLTGAELKDLAGEGADIGPVAKKIADDVSALIAAAKAAL